MLRSAVARRAAQFTTSSSSSASWARVSPLTRLPQTTLSSSLQPRCFSHFYSSSSAPSASSDSSSSPKKDSSSSTNEDLEWLKFEDSEAAFQNRTSSELVRAWLVFRVCSFPWLVRRARRLVAVADAVVGKRLVTWGLRRTFFAHFCAGETQEELLPIIDRLRASGIGSILDYAAEADLPPTSTSNSSANNNNNNNNNNGTNTNGSASAATVTPATAEPVNNMSSTSASSSGEQPSAPSPAQFFRPDKSLDRREGVVSARTYYYEDEAHCDANAETFVSCIDSAGMRPDGFAAIKVTALCPPVLLMRISHILEESRRLFRSLSEAEGGKNGHQSVPYMSRMISKTNFVKVLGMLNVDLSPAEQAELFSAMDLDKNGVVDYVEWLESVQPNDATLHPFFAASADAGSSSGVRQSLLPKLNEKEMQQMNNMVDRLERLAERAAHKKVHLMVDAEQTYFQPAIDHMVINLQKKFNRNFPAIYNTYQCYLTNTAGRVEIDLTRADRHGYYFAAKLVRGAYMLQERKRADKFGYKDPIFATIQETHDNYHHVMETILQNIKRAQIMVASHNEQSLRFAVEKMREYDIPRQGGGVYFGQLLGMCDHVSYSLGAQGYGVYKYVPYGPVREVLPYLIRRAEENGDMLSGAHKERRLIAHELRRRHSPL